MKVLIISDSHGLTSDLEEIKNRHENEVDLMVHCGDSELSETADELSSFSVVKGNCDFGTDFPEEVMKNIDEFRLYVTHGHLFNVKSSLINLKYRALEIDAKIVCFGHSHIAGAEMIGQILFINPGSIKLPVMRKQKTYAILEVIDSIAKVTFHELNGQIIEELKKQFNLHK